MRKLASVLIALSSIPLAVWACDGDTTAAPPASDASTDDVVEASADAITSGDDSGPTKSCMLDDGTDPVALCTQKLVLQSETEAAFIKTLGVAASWDSKTFLPDTDDGGATIHGVMDDVAYAASIVSYVAAANEYGDNEITAAMEDVLVAMATNIEMELASPSTGYSGELYKRLRAIAAGLRVINENTHADKLDAIAEANGRTIAAAFTSLGGGDGVLGTSAGGGQVAYTTADVATGALALIDMALRHAGDDASTDPATWISEAQTSLDHLWNRARDPVTGLYYRALVTSGDVGHDALASVDALPQDALLTDVQASTMLAGLRANAVVIANPTVTALAPLSTYPFTDHADVVFKAMGTLGLWDSQDKGYFEAYFPSLGTFLTNKPTRANALMFAAVHRKIVDAPPMDAGTSTPEFVQVKGLRILLAQATPLASSLFSIIDSQSAYLRAGSSDYKLAHVPVLTGGVSSDAGDGGDAMPVDAGVVDAAIEPRAASYTAAATAAVLEGFTDQLYGTPH